VHEQEHKRSRKADDPHLPPTYDQAVEHGNRDKHGIGRILIRVIRESEQRDRNEVEGYDPHEHLGDLHPQNAPRDNESDGRDHKDRETTERQGGRNAQVDDERPVEDARKRGAGRIADRHVATLEKIRQ